MKTYTVNFWYYTDLRCHWTGPASNELAALVLALNKELTGDFWIDNGEGFRIEIKLSS